MKFTKVRLIFTIYLHENLTKKIKIYGVEDYTPTKFSNIFLSIEEYYDQRSKLSKIKINEKKSKRQ